MSRVCSIEGCEAEHIARGWCTRHYQSWRAHGDPLASTTRRSTGSGQIDSDGYHRRTENGVTKMEHVRIAERALQKPLPAGAVVHHVDENKSNNDPSNLVICPDHAYHNMIHKRMRAFAACGHYDWLKCWMCKQYDDPKNLRFYRQNSGVHLECNRLSQQVFRAQMKDTE